MKKTLIVQIALSLIFIGAFAAGKHSGLLDSVIPVIERDNSIADIAVAAVETIRSIGTG
jgi:hypothetical protein